MQTHFPLPVRARAPPAEASEKGTQDLIVHILAKGQRYEVANYPNATIPTNLDVSENARDKFGSVRCYAVALRQDASEKNPKAVVTEYAWDAGTCDPCPGPALDGNDLATLGADAMPPDPDTADSAPKTAASQRRGFNLGYMPSGYTVTRLHARYTKEALGEDLVFRAAPAILGGREMRAGPGADLEASARRGDRRGPTTLQGAATRSAIRGEGRDRLQEPATRGIWGADRRGSKAADCRDGARRSPRRTSPSSRATFRSRRSCEATSPSLAIRAEGAPVSAWVMPPDAGATPDVGADASARLGRRGRGKRKSGCTPKERLRRVRGRPTGKGE